MDALITIIQFLVVLTVVVLVHEFGHFAAAKAFGIKVNEFGWGFPPRVVRLFRKGDTEYTINLIPLGGFVRLEGENDPSQPHSLASKGVGTRFIVLVAGVVMNMVLAIVLLTGLFIFTVGELKVGQPDPGSPAQLAGLLPGDAILEVNGDRVQTFGELSSVLGRNRGTEMELLVRQDGVERLVRLVPGVGSLPQEVATGVTVDTMAELRVRNVSSGSPADLSEVISGDVILAVNGDAVTGLNDLTNRINASRGTEIEWLLLRDGAERSVRLVPRVEPVPGQGATGITLDIAGEILVREVAPGSPAALAGIIPGDIILAVNGTEVEAFHQLASRIDRNLGKMTEIRIQREGVERDFRLVPLEDALPKEPSAGMTVDFEGQRAKPVRPPWDAMALGFKFIGTIPKVTKDAIADWISDDGDIPFAGPVGIAQGTGEIARQHGLISLIPLAAILSVSLAFMNILPIPALDGGRILFVAIEWVRRGKRISPEKEGLVHLVGFVVLLAMILGPLTYNDIVRLVEGGSLVP